MVQVKISSLTPGLQTQLARLGPGWLQCSLPAPPGLPLQCAALASNTKLLLKLGPRDRSHWRFLLACDPEPRPDSV